MLKSLQINNLLSFGPNAGSVTLHPLNVLVGPNGSGKSNFLQAIRILQRIPDDVSQFWKTANQPQDWLWRQDSASRLVLACKFFDLNSYRVEFLHGFGTLYPDSELLINERSSAYINRSGLEYSVGVSGDMIVSDGKLFDGRKSVFSFYREGVTKFTESLTNIKIYSDRPIGLKTALRVPQGTDTDSAFLSEQFDNLPLVLHELNNRVSVEALLLSHLQKFYPRVSRIYMGLVGGRAQVFLQEAVGGTTINMPASRLSDGTLSFLCLLTILCHPTPPPLICLEEPELGLHPDALPLIAELLVEASQRTQLVVTTHSDLLVSAIGKRDPEAILVCEHTPEEGTTMTRPNPERLQRWLNEGDESLGDIWLRGAIGGTLY